MDKMGIKLNGGFRNEIYYLKEQEKIVRISTKDPNVLLQEIEWVTFLHQNDVSVAKPDMEIEIREGKVYTYFDFIKGQLIDVTNESHWNASIFEQLGKMVGKMHTLSKVYKSKTNYRPQWTNDHPDVFGIRNNLNPMLQEKYDRLMNHLCSYNIRRDTYGMIHNDFHQGNIIMSDAGVLTAIDFDDCTYNWFAQDIAVLFYHAYWQHASFNEESKSFKGTFLEHFFTGYQSENLLHEDTIKQIPIFLKLREILLYHLFTGQWNMNHLEDWQKYTLVNLEKNIRDEVPYAQINDFSIFV